MEQQLALRAKADAVPALPRDRDRVRRKIAAAGEELAAARQRFADTTRPLKWEEKQLTEQIAAGVTADRELYHSCPYPPLLARREQVRAAVAEAEAAAARVDRHSTPPRTP